MLFYLIFNFDLKFMFDSQTKVKVNPNFGSSKTFLNSISIFQLKHFIIIINSQHCSQYSTTFAEKLIFIWIYELRRLPATFLLIYETRISHLLSHKAALKINFAICSESDTATAAKQALNFLIYKQAKHASWSSSPSPLIKSSSENRTGERSE